MKGNVYRLKNIGNVVFAPRGTLWTPKEIECESLLVRGVLFYALCLTTGAHRGVILLEQADEKEKKLFRCEVCSSKELCMQQASEECMCAAYAAARQKNLVEKKVRVHFSKEMILLGERRDGTIYLCKKEQ
ncbi:MAG: hypothetical protein ACI4HI_17315 [Lachnospiraceae bacterium]